MRRRGHIARKNGRFYAVIDLGRDELSGKRRRRWSTGYATEGEADAELVRLLHALDEGASIDRSKLTVKHYLCER